jgi:hypothetical protein
MKPETYSILEMLTHGVQAEGVFAFRDALRIGLRVHGVADVDPNESPADKLLA